MRSRGFSLFSQICGCLVLASFFFFFQLMVVGYVNGREGLFHFLVQDVIFNVDLRHERFDCSTGQFIRSLGEKRFKVHHKWIFFLYKKYFVSYTCPMRLEFITSPSNTLL